MNTEKKTSSAWLERVEEIIGILKGSSVGEIELTEDGTEIIIRRSPEMVLIPIGTQAEGQGLAGAHAGEAAGMDKTVPILAPLTGVYYSAASPSTPPFVSLGEIVQVGQVIALVEAMKVFNEINAEVSGRVTSLVATTGAVVQKGDTILRIEPL